MSVRHLSRPEARRIAVSAQLLSADRPLGLTELVEDLTLVQIEPTAAVAPSADLVLWSRLGGGYEPRDLVEALEVERTVFDQVGFIRPSSAIALHVPDTSSFTTHPSVAKWVQANDAFRRDLLTEIATGGPRTARELPDSAALPWASSGWNDQRNVRQMLELMSARGELAVAGRRGRERVWDLAERVYPPFQPLPPEEAERRRSAGRLKALGLARATLKSVPGEPNGVGDTGLVVTVEGTAGEWRVDPDALDLPFTGRTALLSPLDRLVFDRERMRELFAFDYALEMYKPAAKRRWGYFALPVLHHDRLVAKLDAKADRSAGTLTVHALHEDVALTRAARADIEQEISNLAEWLGLELRTP